MNDNGCRFYLCVVNVYYLEESSFFYLNQARPWDLSIKWQRHASLTFPRSTGGQLLYLLALRLVGCYKWKPLTLRPLLVKDARLLDMSALSSHTHTNTTCLAHEAKVRFYLVGSNSCKRMDGLLVWGPFETSRNQCLIPFRLYLLSPPVSADILIYSALQGG